MGKKSMKMSLENYIDFYGNPDHISLCINHLNQIIFMHGFRKLNLQKKTIAEATNTLDLLVPFRSTLNDQDTFSSSACITVTEMLEDISALEWHECPVQSISTVRSEMKNLSGNDELHGNCVSSSNEGIGAKCKSKRKRKASKRTGIVAQSDSLVPATAASSCPSS